VLGGFLDGRSRQVMESLLRLLQNGDKLLAVSGVAGEYFLQFRFYISFDQTVIGRYCRYRKPRYLRYRYLLPLDIFRLVTPEALFLGATARERSFFHQGTLIFYRILP